ncbi:MAG: aldehyde dehydrogenase family protein [Anaerovoracaceae bacterium]
MELKKMLKRQRSFFESGTSRDLEYRRSALLKLKKNIKNNEEAIIDALREDLGKSPFESYETEIGMVYQEISYMLKHLRRLSAPKRVGTPLSCFPAVSRIYPEPYGVVLIMSPWNYPFQLTMVPLIGAIAAGNCAVVKPSAYSPAVSALVKKILSEIFSESYVCVVLGGREENRELLEMKYDYLPEVRR